VKKRNNYRPGLCFYASNEPPPAAALLKRVNKLQITNEADSSVIQKTFFFARNLEILFDHFERRENKENKLSREKNRSLETKLRNFHFFCFAQNSWHREHV
jgi:hypothetical protein